MGLDLFLFFARINFFFFEVGISNLENLEFYIIKFDKLVVRTPCRSCPDKKFIEFYIIKFYKLW